MRIALITSVLTLALAGALASAAIAFTPTKSECAALEAWRDANPDAAVKPEEKACLVADLDALRAAAIAERDAIDAKIQAAERVAPKVDGKPVFRTEDGRAVFRDGTPVPGQ